MNEDDEISNASTPYDTGYGRPPERTRFKPGQSGNPRGRPRRRHRLAPYEGVLGQRLTIRDGGTEKKVTAAEAFLLQITQRGLAGDNAAARATIRAIEEVRAHGPATAAKTVSFCWRAVTPGSVNSALKALRLAELIDGYSEENTRIMLSPWIVEAALERMTGTTLTAEQQNMIKIVTLPAGKNKSKR